MLVLSGSSVLSASRRAVLLSEIQKRLPNVASVDTLYVHLVQCSDAGHSALASASSPQRVALDHLLAYGDNIHFANTRSIFSSGKNVAYVTPRPGSISPWSSKATDITVICGLGQYVQRLERGVSFVFATSDGSQISPEDISCISSLIHDRMTQVVQLALPPQEAIFAKQDPRPLQRIALDGTSPRDRLLAANSELGLALAPDEIDYLVHAFVSGPSPIARDPTDAELFMFAQVNSEHCRHKIFNASWTLDSVSQPHTLFQMIRHTERTSPTGTISAYSDNAAVLEGSPAPRFASSKSSRVEHMYDAHEEDIPILIKVETHNHPTAVSPFPGAATGSGGEIRDEGAVGRGSKPKAGLSGFATSDLLIPNYAQPWELNDVGKPNHISSALDIMLEAPLGASAFNNEFGRPALTGFFRTLCAQAPGALQGHFFGYHKPIMVAGGYGNVRPAFAHKRRFASGARLVVLGGPGLLIGLGGGAASSQALGASSAELDFASVQRDNAEMQRRCQQVIDACVNMGDTNPIASIHDVGAGGLSNALPELVHDAGLGATLEIRDVLVADTSMSPMEIWCNESQERYVLAVEPESLDELDKIAKRERCPYSVVGFATEETELVVTDSSLNTDVIRLSMSTLFGKPPRMSRADYHRVVESVAFDTTLSRYLGSLPEHKERLSVAFHRVLRLPSVASKSFLITIGDRTITGLVTRDQMVGPWQVPVADVAVTRSSYGFDVTCGEAMAMGERTPVAMVDAASSARMAVAEALTNLVAAYVGPLSRVKLSANWMCAASKPGEGAGLYDAVQAVGLELCPALGIGVPVGKDSMSMSMKWSDGGIGKDVSAPLSLIVTAFAPVVDVARTWTPMLRVTTEPSVLVFVDLARGKQRLGGSALAQVFKQIGADCPDVEDAGLLKAFFTMCQNIRSNTSDLVLAFHDRSDGGMLAAVAEMCFAGRIGANVWLSDFDDLDPVSALFNEELGGIMQVLESRLPELVAIATENSLPSAALRIMGRVNKAGDESFVVTHHGQVLIKSSRGDLQTVWAETSFQMQSLRDDPITARQEFDLITTSSHRGVYYDLKFAPEVPREFVQRPKVAILREQGVNGQTEMAWAFCAAGFDAIDVHMSDILSGRTSLSNFRGLAACGGFSYGDVLGAGKGWAHSVLLHRLARDEFAAFFGRQDTFALGVCNGCQFMSHLKEIIPGAQNWPQFKPNKSGRFEARVCVVEVVDSEVTRQSAFLADMVNSKLPVAVAHGEGCASFDHNIASDVSGSQGLIAVRYVDGSGMPTEVYPLNPNGSAGGITGVQTPDGRILALMPHPERVTTLESNSWYPPEMKVEWGGVGPWFRLFQNARRWCGA